MTIEDELRGVAQSAGSEIHLHARDLDSDRQVGIGADRIEKTMRELGLASVTVGQACRDIYAQLAVDTGAGSAEELDELVARNDPDVKQVLLERLRDSSVLDPAHTNAATPADVTRLLQLL